MGFNINVEGNSKNNKTYINAEWISVEYRLPDHRQTVLVYCNNYRGDVGFGYGGGEEPVSVCTYGDDFVTGEFIVVHTDYYEVKALEVTHWTPLPEPPKEN